MSPKQFSVKEVQEKDWPLLKQLVDEVWPATFKDILSEAQITYMMEMMYSEASLKKQTETGSIFYILYSKLPQGKPNRHCLETDFQFGGKPRSIKPIGGANNEEPCGYLAIIPQFTNEKLTTKGTVTKVDKIYVLPKTQGTGAGRFLMDFAFAEAKKAGDLGVTLNVNRDNKATSFYEYYGFKNMYSEDFDIGKGYLMEDHIMYYPF